MKRNIGGNMLEKQQRERALVDFINDEVARARAEASDIIVNRMEIDTVGCTDPKMRMRGKWAPAGGIAFLDLEEHLEDFIRVRAKAGVKELTLAGHLHCGYLYVIHGLQTIAEQKTALETAEKHAKNLGKKYGIVIYVPAPENDGSAKDFMMG